MQSIHFCYPFSSLLAFRHEILHDYTTPLAKSDTGLCIFYHLTSATSRAYLRPKPSSSLLVLQGVFPEDRMREKCPQAALLPTDLKSGIRPRVASENGAVATSTLVKGIRLVIAFMVNAYESSRLSAFSTCKNILDERIILCRGKRETAAFCTYGRFVLIGRVQCGTTSPGNSLDGDTGGQVTPFRHIQIEIL